MPGLVSLIAKLSLECCGMWHHELFTVPAENNASYVLHLDLMLVICMLRRSSSSVVSVLKKFIVLCFIHSLYDNLGRLEVKPYDLPTNSSS